MATTLPPQQTRGISQKRRYAETLIGVADLLVDFEPVWALFEGIADVVDPMSAEVRDFAQRQSMLIRFAEKVIEGREGANPGATIGFGCKLDREIEAYLNAWIGRETVERRFAEVESVVTEYGAELWSKKEAHLKGLYTRYVQQLASPDNDLDKVVPLCAALERELRALKGLVEPMIAAARAREEAERAREEAERVQRESDEAAARARAVLSRLRRDEE